MTPSSYRILHSKEGKLTFYFHEEKQEIYVPSDQ